MPLLWGDRAGSASVIPPPQLVVERVALHRDPTRFLDHTHQLVDLLLGLGLRAGRVEDLLADDGPLADNPFAPVRAPRPTVADSAPRKLRLLGRGLGVVGSYAKVLLADDVPVAYCQFGPLTAYPRAQRTRDLYPALPDAPLPAVITCIASTATARGAGLAKALVAAVCEDLEGRGFAAVETYPEVGIRPDATSAATPAFWESVGFVTAAPDERFPVMRRDLR